MLMERRYLPRLDQYLIDRGRVQADGQGWQSGGASIGAAWALEGVI